MTKEVVIVLVWTLLCSVRCFAQVSEVRPNVLETNESMPELSAPPLRSELKQFVSKMTFEAGDRRILHLPTQVQTVKIHHRNKVGGETATAPRLLRKRHNAPKQISVECNPLGEAEAIGVIPDSHQKPKGRRDTIDVYASEDVELSLEKWRRLATLACLEDEI